jgi:hypothetical protein
MNVSYMPVEDLQLEVDYVPVIKRVLTEGVAAKIEEGSREAARRLRNKVDQYVIRHKLQVRVQQRGSALHLVPKFKLAQGAA